MQANGHDAVAEEKPKLGAMQWSLEVKGLNHSNYVRVAYRISSACGTLPGLSKHIKVSWMRDAVLLKSLDGVPITKEDIELLVSGIPQWFRAWIGESKPLTKLEEIRPKNVIAKAELHAKTEPNAGTERKRITPRSASNEEEQLAQAKKALRGVMGELSAVDSLIAAKEKILLQKLGIWRADEIRDVQGLAEEKERQARIEASDAHKKQKETHEAKMRSLDAQEKRYTDHSRTVTAMGALHKVSPDFANVALHMMLDTKVDLATSSMLRNALTSVFSATCMTLFLTAYRLGDADAHRVAADIITWNKKLDAAKVVALIGEIHPLNVEVGSAVHMKESEKYALFVKVVGDINNRARESDYDETIRMLRDYCAERLEEIRREKIEEIRKDARAHSEIDDRRDSARKGIHAARDARIEEIESSYLEMKANVRPILEPTVAQELGRQHELEKTLFERATRLGVDGEQKRKLRNGH